MKICSDCGNKYYGIFTACPQCGSKIHVLDTQLGDSENMDKLDDLCSKCGTEYVDGNDYCVKCGNKRGMPQTIMCVKCGYELKDGHEFCPKCGTQKVIHNICNKCKAELDGEFDFCPKCGQIKTSINSPTNMNSSTPLQSNPVSNYPIIIANDPVSIRKGLICLGGALLTIFSYFIIFYVGEYASGADISINIIFGLCLIISSIASIVYFATMKKKYYVLLCPYCKKEIPYPLDEQACDCCYCNNRVIMSDGIIKKVGD